MKTFLLILSIAFASQINAEESNQAKKDSAESNEVNAGARSNLVAHLDILAGLAIPTGANVSGLDSRFGYGAQLLFDTNSSFSIGAYFLTNDGTIKNSETISVRLSYYGIVAQYKLTPMIYTQFKVGSSSLSISSDTTTITASGNPFTVSAGLGCDLPINNNVSFGPFVGYTNSFKAEQTKTFGLVEVMGALRFRF